MDSRDRLRLRLVGTGCGACGRPYLASGISVLAQRDDLAFVLLHCGHCGSDGLGLVTDGEPDDAVAGGSEARTRLHGELSTADERRLRDAEPITADDVLAVHELLSHGGIRGLLGEAERGADGP